MCCVCRLVAAHARTLTEPESVPCAMAQPDVSVARDRGAEPFGAGTLSMFVRSMHDSTSGAEVVTGGTQVCMAGLATIQMKP